MCFGSLFKTNSRLESPRIQKLLSAAHNNYMFKTGTGLKNKGQWKVKTFKWEKWHDFFTLQTIISSWFWGWLCEKERQIYTFKEWEDVQLNKENLLYSHDWFFLWLFAEAATDKLSFQQHLVQTHVMLLLVGPYSSTNTVPLTLTGIVMSFYYLIIILASKAESRQNSSALLKQKVLPTYLTFLV